MEEHKKKLGTVFPNGHTSQLHPVVTGRAIHEAKLQVMDGHERPAYLGQPINHPRIHEHEPPFNPRVFPSGESVRPKLDVEPKTGIIEKFKKRRW